MNRPKAATTTQRKWRHQPKSWDEKKNFSIFEKHKSEGEREREGNKNNLGETKMLRSVVLSFEQALYNWVCSIYSCQLKIWKLSEIWTENTRKETHLVGAEIIFADQLEHLTEMNGIIFVYVEVWTLQIQIVWCISINHSTEMFRHSEKGRIGLLKREAFELLQFSLPKSTWKDERSSSIIEMKSYDQTSQYYSLSHHPTFWFSVPFCILARLLIPSAYKICNKSHKNDKYDP